MDALDDANSVKASAWQQKIGPKGPCGIQKRHRRSVWWKLPVGESGEKSLPKAAAVSSEVSISCLSHRCQPMRDNTFRHGLIIVC